MTVLLQIESPTAAAPLQVTEVRVTLADEPGRGGKIRAYCKVLFNGALAGDGVKVIAPRKDDPDRLIVTMPDRDTRTRCPRCRSRVTYSAAFCSACGFALPEFEAPVARRGRLRLWHDVAHPVNQAARELVERAVLGAYHRAVADREGARELEVAG